MRRTSRLGLGLGRIGCREVESAAVSSSSCQIKKGDGRE